MMNFSSRLAAATLASLLLAGSAYAQTAPAAAEQKTQKPRSAASLECSKQADAKGLHGKERKKFRSECKKDAAGKAATDTK